MKSDKDIDSRHQEPGILQNPHNSRTKTNKPKRVFLFLSQLLLKILRKLRPNQEPLKWVNLASLSDKLKHIRNIIVNFIVITLLILLCILTYFEFTKSTILIEPFEVPEELRRNGYTGRAIANKLMDKLNYIKIKSETTRKFPQFSPVWHHKAANIEVSGVAFSPKSFLEYIKEFFGRGQTRITGEVILQGNLLKVTIRVSGDLEETCSGPWDTPTQSEILDSLLLQSAKCIYESTEPYILALFLYCIEEKEASLQTIKHCLRHDPSDDDSSAYSLWGFMLQEQRKYDEAILKFQKSIELDPKDAYSYTALGVVLCKQRKYDEAILKFQKSIELDLGFSDAYGSWGVLLYEQEDYDGAIAKFEKAAELDSKSAAAYFGWGLVLEKQEDYEGAITKFEKAAELDPYGRVGERASILIKILEQRAKMKQIP